MADEFSNVLIESILEHSPVAVLVTDEKGIIIFVNREAGELFGYTRDELLGKEVEILLPQNIRNKHRLQRTDYLQHDAQPRRMGIGRDLFGLHKEGNFIPIEIGLNPIFIMEKTYVVATIINITERKHKQDQQLDQLIKNLERSNRELEEYAHLLSHDLQNPLAVVYSYTEALEGEVNEQHQALIAKIKGAVHRMSRLTANLLELSRTVRQKPQFMSVELNDILATVMSELQVQFDQTGAKIIVERLRAIEVDPTLIGELFQNLLTNASKYRKPDIPSEIKISGKEEGECYVMRFEDNGIGMRGTDQIFTLFHRQPESSGSVTGHGVGLAVCKKIVDLHHGEITVESKEGVGTTFIVKLPIKQG